MSFIKDLLKWGAVRGVRDPVTGGIANLTIGGDNYPLRGSPLRRLVFVGDSLTNGNTSRQAGFFSGYPYWNATPTLTNLGGSVNPWILETKIRGDAPATPSGVLRTDGVGGLQWSYNSEGYGPIQNVSQGGWYYLASGSSAYGLWVSVRGGVTAPASVGTGSVAGSGSPYIRDYDLIGFSAWVAGALGDSFSDYQPWSIGGSTSTDLLKFMPQVMATPAEAVVILIGTNDLPATAAAANTVIANVKAAVDLALANSSRVYIGDIFPRKSGDATATIQKYLSLVSNSLRAWSKTQPRVRFWSAYDRLIDPTAVGVTLRTGAYHTDSIHMMPFGAYQASRELVRMLQEDYPITPTRRASLDAWDSTVDAGAWNLNPTLRGTAGTVTGGGGVTGTAPDNWTLSRAVGTTQLCTTSFDTAADGGPSWWSMSVSSNTDVGGMHDIRQTTSLPAGINVGDYFRVVAEICIFGTTSPGLALLSIFGITTGAAQTAYVVDLSRNISTFSSENVVLQLQSQPQLVLSGTTAHMLRFRVGADSGGAGVGKVGIRNLRIEKCSAPIAVS